MNALHRIGLALGNREPRPGSQTLRSAAAAALLLSAALPAAADPVKLLLPEQYRSRVVAPKKGRVLVVNFWATWCEPCREEMPALIEAGTKFPAKDLAVTLVSIDDPKTGAGSVPKFLSTMKVPFVCWLAKARDPLIFIDAVDKSWDGTVPFTLVYDRKGQLSAKLAGKHTVAEFSEAVKKALAK